MAWHTLDSRHFHPIWLLGDAAVLDWGHHRACGLPILSTRRFRHLFLRFRMRSPDGQQEDAAGHQVYRSIPCVSFGTARAVERALPTEVVVCLRISRISQAQPKWKDSDITDHDGGCGSFDVHLGAIGCCGILDCSRGPTRWRALAVAAGGHLCILAAMALAAVQKQDADEKLRSQLTNFDVMNAKCSNEFDRQCIHDLIITWYGSLSAFNDYIQGPFCLEVLQLRRSQRCIEGHYLIFLLLPNTSYFLEGSLAFSMSGAPAEVSISYFLAVVLCFNLIWLPSVIVLGAYLTQQGIRLGRFKIKPSLLEPLLICLLCLILLSLGIGAAIAAVFRGIEMSILWNIVGLVFAAVIWMKCWRV
ncbi:unnamed protein product [Symbiodinium sp. CCMP2592]|nr:unnamed protein product [Symbiodinium sp. CCMP2592]